MIYVCPVRRNRKHELIFYLHCTVYRSVCLGQGHSHVFRAFEGTKQDLILLSFWTVSFHIQKQTQHFVKQICSQPLEKEWESIHLNMHSSWFLTEEKFPETVLSAVCVYGSWTRCALGTNWRNQRNTLFSYRMYYDSTVPLNSFNMACSVILL